MGVIVPALDAFYVLSLLYFCENHRYDSPLLVINGVCKVLLIVKRRQDSLVVDHIEVELGACQGFAGLLICGE